MTFREAIEKTGVATVRERERGFLPAFQIKGTTYFEIKEHWYAKETYRHLFAFTDKGAIGFFESKVTLLNKWTAAMDWYYYGVNGKEGQGLNPVLVYDSGRLYRLFRPHNDQYGCDWIWVEFQMKKTDFTCALPFNNL